MRPDEVRRYNGKAVDFGNYHGPSTGIVHEGVCYRIIYPGVHAKVNNSQVNLVPESPYTLDYIREREEGLTTLMEKAILEALKNNQPEATLRLKIKKL